MRELALFNLNVSDVEIKEATSSNEKIGVFVGHLATFDKDRTDDVFVKGAFTKSIDRHKDNGQRSIRMLGQHDSDQLIGGFPISKVREDEKGLWVEGNINLEVQRGKELFSLMKQGVLSDMSIGFSIPKNGQEFKNGTRFIKEAEIWEGSLVTEPANIKAQIVAIKSQSGGSMTPISDEEVKEFTKRDLEDALREGKEFTKAAAKTVASLFSGQATAEEKEAKALEEKQEQEASDKVLEELGDIKSLFKNKD